MLLLDFRTLVDYYRSIVQIKKKKKKKTHPLTMTTSLRRTRPVAGNLVQHVSKWYKLTTGSWISETISVYHLEFSSRPFQPFCPTQISCCRNSVHASKGCDSDRSTLQGGVYLNSFFLVPKKVVVSYSCLLETLKLICREHPF